MSAGDPTPDTDIAAAELALGLLAGEDREAAIGRARADPGFAAEVAWWRARAVLLFGDGLPLFSLWPAILARLPKPDDAAPASRKLAVWRAVAVISTAAALTLAALLLVHPARQPLAHATAPLVATLGSSDRSETVAVVFYASRDAIIATPVKTRAVTRAAELWVVPAAGAPVSLGLLAQDRATERALGSAVAHLLSQGATLAISVEPSGGSPTGQPTGPVILTGKLIRNGDAAPAGRGSSSKET